LRQSARCDAELYPGNPTADYAGLANTLFDGWNNDAPRTDSREAL
jgi:hypothetical protein